MFASISANFRYNSGWVIQKRKQTVDQGGNEFEVYTNYTGVYINFFHSVDDRRRSNDGNWIDVDGGAWISHQSVTGFTIDAHDTYISGTEGQFRIMSVIKDNRYPYQGYYVTLKGDSLNAY
jgi:hypothetical protein